MDGGLKIIYSIHFYNIDNITFSNAYNSKVKISFHKASIERARITISSA